jgi:integrase
MRKTELRITKTKVRRGKQWERYWCVIVPKLGGGRTRRFFKFTEEGKAEAETFLQISKTQQANFGTAALTLSPAQREEYIECTEALKPFGVTVREAVKLLLPQLRAKNRSCTVKELVEELLKVKRADGASARYLGDLESRLGHFARDFEGRSVASISSVEVDGWLRGLRLSATTRNNYRRVLIVAFNFAKANGYCVANPAETASKAKQIEAAPGILTPAELARLLEHSPTALLPVVAIGAFAGLRRAELERLDWSEVDLQSGLIQVTASKAKSARRRFVKIQSCLAEWLQPLARTEGRVEPENSRGLIEEAREAAKIKEWPSNALRHSFASYHLAKFQDAAALALEMGHTNSALVFQHYRELVKPNEAERYWNIRPASVDNVVAMTA